MRLLDRYVVRNFLIPFLLCFFGFIAILLVFDLADHFGDFLDANISLPRILLFYATQLPQFSILSLPIGLLLAVLYSLSRMSRSNEIISMLTAGISVTRLLIPLMLIGVLVSLICFLCDYELGPHAEGAKKSFMDALRGKKKALADEQIFRNRTANRTWYVKMMPKNPIPTEKTELSDIYITLQDNNGNIIQKFYAKRAIYNPQDASWDLQRGKTVQFDTEGNILKEDLWLDDHRMITDWNETPWRIASSNLDPDFLSIPELEDFIQYNSDFPPATLAPYKTTLASRWAFPWSCFVVIFISAPLAIVHSRRGMFLGIASAILLYVVMYCSDYLFRAFGKSDHMPHLAAAWGSNTLFLVVGLLLIYFRNTNRELPKFSLFARRKS